MRASHVLAACFSLVASIVVFSAHSFATTVAPVEGELKVNSGKGFRPVSAATEVAPGDALIVAPGGKAVITYSETCQLPILPGQVAVVAPVSPCARGQADIFTKAPPQDYTGYYLLGGAAAVGLGVGIWVVTKPSPASP
jgi:hypothetical protein